MDRGIKNNVSKRLFLIVTSSKLYYFKMMHLPDASLKEGLLASACNERAGNLLKYVINV